jgi:hypothetical protein
MFDRYHELRDSITFNFYNELFPLVQIQVDKGMSLSQIARWLNDRNILTLRGKKWSVVMVGRVLKKLGLKTIYTA